MKPCKISTQYCNGRGRPTIYIDGEQWLQHRWVYTKHHGKTLTSKDVIMHLCDNIKCIEITHLKLGTQADNIADMVSKNRHTKPKGSKNGSSVLTEKEVLEIRNKFENSWESKQDLAMDYKVDVKTIREILSRRSWTHI